MRIKTAIAFLLILLLSACSNNNTTDYSENSYEITKQLIIDTLKTDEGKAALTEIFAEEEMKEQLVINQEIVQSAIADNLLSDQAMSFWKKALEDPSFATVYAQSLEQAHKQLLKDLMQDADYRELLLEVLNNPEMDKQIAEVINSNEVRAELKSVIIETFNSPLLQNEIKTILSEGAPNDNSTDTDESSQTDTGSGGEAAGSSGEDSNASP